MPLTPRLRAQETVLLRGKFRQSLQLLKSYQQRLIDPAASDEPGDSAAQPQPAAGGGAPAAAMTVSSSTTCVIGEHAARAPAQPTHPAGEDQAASSPEPAEAPSQSGAGPSGTTSIDDAHPPRFEVR